MRLRRLRRWWPVPAAVLVALVIYAAWPGRSTFNVSPETTYITEPLDAGGRPDYPSALNERLRRGVTPETNANVLLWQALGPRPEGALLPPEYFKWLGVEQPPEEGEYLLPSDKYFQAHLKDRPRTEPAEADGIDDPDRLQEWRDQLGRTQKWPWKARDHPDVADWLKRNEKPLAVTAAAVRRPQYYNPLVPSGSDPEQPRLSSSLMPNVQRSRELANALTCRAMRRIADGDPDGAWQDLMVAQQLGRQVARGATLIEGLVGYALVAVATNGQVTLLGHGPHPSGRVRAWLEELRRLPPMPPFADKLDLGERFFVLDALTTYAITGEQPFPQTGGNPAGQPAGPRLLDTLFRRSIDWDPALRKANRTLDQYVVAARLPDRAARKREFAKINEGFDQASRASIRRSALSRVAMGRTERGEWIGNILLGLALPAMEKVHDAADRVEQTQRNLQVALALAACRADVGRYPGRLDELVPKYLPALPGDLLSGGPLVYRPAGDGYLLYSVGVNGKDEDGRWMDDDPPGDDPRVRMPVAEPKAKPKPKPVRPPGLDID